MPSTDWLWFMFFDMLLHPGKYILETLKAFVSLCEVLLSGGIFTDVQYTY